MASQPLPSPTDLHASSLPCPGVFREDFEKAVFGDKYLDREGKCHICKRFVLQHPEKPRELKQDVSVVDRFVKLLQQAGVTKPDQAAMKWLVGARYLAMQGFVETNDTNGAVDLYEVAKRLPRSQTARALAEHWVINGPFGDQPESSALLRAWRAQDCSPVVIKIPRSGSRELDSTREISALKAADPSLRLMSGEALKIELQHEDSKVVRMSPGVFIGIVFPLMSGTLYGIPRACHPSSTLAELREIVRAVEKLHQRGFVHMDITGNNIFLDFQGHWFLGDYGSMVPVNSSIVSYSKQLLCENLGLNDAAKPALFKYDWLMLVATICCYIGDFEQLRTEYNDPPARVSAERIRCFIRSLPAGELRDLLETLWIRED